MRKVVTEYGYVKLWLSAKDTYNWAHRTGAAWPCSFLADKSLLAEFAPNGDLVELAINYGQGDQDCPGVEFTAITDDFLNLS